MTDGFVLTSYSVGPHTIWHLCTSSGEHKVTIANQKGTETYRVWYVTNFAGTYRHYENIGFLTAQLYALKMLEEQETDNAKLPTE